MSDLPKSVHIMEVGARDGLQIEPKFVPTEEKVRMIEAIVDAGVKEIEVGSFVNPKAVPQMADTDGVINTLHRKPGVKYRALWLNDRGLTRAVEDGRIDLYGILTLTASETFVKRNTNRTIEETFVDMPVWIEKYRAAGVKPNMLGLMAAYGCNFEGRIPESKIVALVERTAKVMEDNGCKLERLILADTMGWANPLQVKRLAGMLLNKWPELVIKLHLHDTRGCAVANAVAGLEAGIREFDGSVGGLGGCPFAGHKGAAGNLCTEDLVFACEEMGIETGIDIDALIAASRMVEGFVGHELPGKVMKGGSLSRFPRL